MDAASLLKRQGWRGDGHALSTSGNGLKKPLLVSKKVDVLGLGINKHTAVSDQWWMRAFDQGLKDLGTGKRGVLNDVREKGIALGGLYGRFVKGEGVAGTFKEDDKSPDGKKRKRDDAGTVEARKAPKLEATARLRKDLDRQVEAFVVEALKRGLIPEGEKAKPSRKPSKSPVERHGVAAVAKVFVDAGLETGSSNAKAAKYDRSKLERKVKKVARAFILTTLSSEERKQIEDEDEEVEQNRKRDRQVAKAKESDEAAELAEAKKMKALRKAEKRDRKRARGEEDDSSSGADSANGTDDISLGQPKKKTKTIPGVGAVDRYPTKAEKRAKKLQAQGISTAPTQSMYGTEDLGFVVDTIGDATIAKGFDAVTVVDAKGNVRYSGSKDDVVPLDPTVWEGVDVKTLPKAVRKARREWMAQKREVRTGGPKVDTTKSRGEWKAAEREKFIGKILARSSLAMLNASEARTATIDGVPNVPLVTVETTEGHFSKDEMALARTVARRVLKSEKVKTKSDGGKKQLSNGRNDKTKSKAPET